MVAVQASSPACTELETIVMDWLGKLIGLPSVFLHSNKQTMGGGVIQVTGDAPHTGASAIHSCVLRQKRSIGEMFDERTKCPITHREYIMFVGSVCTDKCRLQTTASEATFVALLAARTEVIKRQLAIDPDTDIADINSRLVAYCSDQVLVVTCLIVRRRMYR